MTEPWWKPITDPRFIMALVVVGLFGWALNSNPSDDTMKGALIGALNLAVGYYLGSSRGTAESNARTDKALGIAQQNTPQPVTVVNEPDQPVPTTDQRG